MLKRNENEPPKLIDLYPKLISALEWWSWKWIESEDGLRPEHRRRPNMSQHVRYGFHRIVHVGVSFKVQEARTGLPSPCRGTSHFILHGSHDFSGPQLSNWIWTNLVLNGSDERLLKKLMKIWLVWEKNVQIHTPYENSQVYKSLQWPNCITIYKKKLKKTSSFNVQPTLFCFQLTVSFLFIFIFVGVSWTLLELIQ